MPSHRLYRFVLLPVVLGLFGVTGYLLATRPLAEGLFYLLVSVCLLTVVLVTGPLATKAQRRGE